MERGVFILRARAMESCDREVQVHLNYVQFITQGPH